MDVSVIIPTYKPQDYIWTCLDSLINQTLSYDHYEVIVVLNGCCEPWKSQIEDYIASKMSAMNVRFIQTDTPGVSNARNLGIDAMKGKYLFFIDDDDYISSTCLQEMLSLQNGDVVVECYPYAFDDGDQSIEQRAYGLTSSYDYCVEHKCNKLNSTARKFFSGPCMKLIPSLYVGDRRFDTRFKNGEDSLFMFSISDKIHDVAFTTKDAMYYRRYRKGSATTSSRSKKERIKNIIKCMRVYTAFYVKGGYSTYFYATRILAELRCLIHVVFKR